MRGFFSELAKIAEDVAAANPEAAAPILGIPAADLARSLGEAAAYQRAPHLRKAVERAAQLGGFGGEIVSAIDRRPGMAAIMGGLSHAPGVIREIESDVRGYRALKNSGLIDEKDLGDVRNRLLLSGFGKVLPAAASTAAGSMIAARDRGPGLFPMIMMGMLGHRMRAETVGGQNLGMDDAERLRQQMGVEAPFYRGSSGGRGRYIAPESTSFLAPGMQRELTSYKLRSGSKSEARRLLEGGGVVVPSKKMKRGS